MIFYILYIILCIYRYFKYCVLFIDIYFVFVIDEHLKYLPPKMGENKIGKRFHFKDTMLVLFVGKLPAV